mgnify:CR=1 FL=1
MRKNKKTKFVHLGLKDYKETWDYQEEIFRKTVDRKIQNRKVPEEEQLSTENQLIFVYHPHVYTLGKSGKEENLLLDQGGLRKNNAVYYKINRGGDITYHGPGQIVGYPILDLDNFFTDIHKYLRFLEEAVILTLKEYGIIADRIDGLTGVWLDWEDENKARKICALGVKSSRWVTMHGFAFNVNTDLSYFDHIIPCGIDDKGVTSMKAELGHEVDISEVEKKLKKHLVDLFDFELTE